MSSRSTIQREFAVSVVQRLRDCGFEALWAGGCVRDALLNREPKDYDVATSATPEQVIETFGAKKTVPVGVSFGVVMVLGPTRQSGQIEVATFRADGEYLDGRRPETVQFCSAEDDARRRDFTINGMFFDPIEQRVIDYVGGQADLNTGIVRAIGSACDRFTEDKLRMLRAVRFAATYSFELQQETAQAIQQLAGDLPQVSHERIAQELRRMLAHSSRAAAVQQLSEVGLLKVIFPAIFCGADATALVSASVLWLAELKTQSFEPGLAVILQSLFDASAEHTRDRVARIQAECRQLRLSNDETDTVCWLTLAAHDCHDAARVPLHVLKPILADRRQEQLIDFMRSRAVAMSRPPVDADYLADYVARTPRETLDPPPLIDGQDLRQLGVTRGPTFGRILQHVRREQLDEVVETRADALAAARRLASEL